MRFELFVCKLCGRAVYGQSRVKHLEKHKIPFPERPKTGIHYEHYRQLHPESNMSFQEWLNWSSEAWDEYNRMVQRLKTEFFERAEEREVQTFKEWFNENKRLLREVFC